MQKRRARKPEAKMTTHGLTQTLCQSCSPIPRPSRVASFSGAGQTPDLGQVSSFSRIVIWTTYEDIEVDINKIYELHYNPLTQAEK